MQVKNYNKSDNVKEKPEMWNDSVKEYNLHFTLQNFQGQGISRS